MTSIFYLPGMDCPVEEKLVRSSLKGMSGIHSLDFNLLQRKLKIRHEQGSLQEIAEALAGLNMGATLLEEGASAGTEGPSAPVGWQKLGVALLLALVSEICELYPAWANAPARTWELVSLAFAIAAILLCGFSTYRKGWIAIKNLNLNINALMAVAVTGAAVIGQWPEAAMVMVLFNVSEAIESRALLRARDAIKGLMELTPHLAEVRQPDGSWQEEHVHDIGPGAVVRVRPGGKIPLDGRVVSGSSAVNQASITGEAMPVTREKGDFLYAGTLNGNGALEFEVTAAENDTTLARIIHAVEEAQATRAPMQRFVDVFSAWYTPVIFASGLIWAILPPLCWQAPWLSSIYMGLVILVIGCPCALVISTPVTIVSGMAAATRKGILIKGGVFLEQGRLLRCLALDKTGTITRGEPEITNFIVNAADETMAKIAAASLAARSDHPVSGAILTWAAANGITPAEVTDFSAIPGQGIEGVVNGGSYRLGNVRMAGSGLAPEQEEEIRKLESRGRTVTLLMHEASVIAIFAAADQIRPGSIEAIRELEKLGLVPVMLTGDNGLAAGVIAAEAGIEQVRAALLPEQKLDAVAELEAGYGMTGMVGDGINDAPALAKANISFAMAKGGTDTAMETADVALMDDDLRKVPRFIRLSRATYAIMLENITLALAIKAAFFGLALANLATMWMAVFADVGAALIVIANGLRALRK